MVVNSRLSGHKISRVVCTSLKEMSPKSHPSTSCHPSPLAMLQDGSFCAASKLTYLSSLPTHTWLPEVTAPFGPASPHRSAKSHDLGPWGNNHAEGALPSGLPPFPCLHSR